MRGQDVHLHSQVTDGSEDLGELLPASTSLDQRAEVVLETTVDDARSMAESALQWICQNLFFLQQHRKAVSGLVHRYVPPLGCFFTSPWSNGKSCLLCSPKKHGFLDVYCVGRPDGLSWTPP